MLLPCSGVRERQTERQTERQRHRQKEERMITIVGNQLPRSIIWSAVPLPCYFDIVKS